VSEAEKRVQNGYSFAERATVAAAMRGDADAVRSLWQAHRRWVAAILLAHKPREAELEDLLQDVAMTVVRGIADLRDESALKPWLRTVAINTARASGRKAKRAREFAGEVANGWSGEGPAGGALANGAEGSLGQAGLGVGPEVGEEARRLLELAGRLPEGYREPLLLRCVRGMSYRAISEITGLPETTIETRIARGRRMLRELATGHRPAAVGGTEGSRDA
jgi:RNA polymerase sigma factor (sigma-70 family)